jgi:hypothetical protein
MMAVTMINEANDDHLIYEAILLLNELLDNNNIHVKDTLFKHISTSSDSY